ncbi:FAS1 domain-containing protein [Hyaloraphidium curvatum]|nr:FAS1 domain-containing protein [Hyaloraphidium curvatum]
MWPTRRFPPVLWALSALLLVALAPARAQSEPIVATLAATPGFSIFSGLLESFPRLAAALNDTARNSTIFAPDDAALSGLTPGILLLNATQAGRLMLFKTVEYHVHVGSGINVSDLEEGTVLVVPTLAGFDPAAPESALNLTLARRPIATTPGASAVFVNDNAVITTPDIQASNGVIQSVSDLLNPYAAFGPFPPPPVVTVTVSSAPSTPTDTPTVPTAFTEPTFAISTPSTLPTVTFGPGPTSTGAAPSFTVAARLLKRGNVERRVYLPPSQVIETREEKREEGKVAKLVNGIVARWLRGARE